MACVVCEHCQSPVSGDEMITVREGFSYHKRCHKCYVCSETNLQNAEVFKGVIFCASCAQRIFQGCSTARKTKTIHSGRGKRRRSRSHRKPIKRRERTRTQDRKLNGSRDGVIELAGMAGSTTESDDLNKLKKPSKLTPSSELGLQPGKKRRGANCYFMQELKKDSTEMGTTTDVTQELLRQINCPVIPERRVKKYEPQMIMPPKKHHRKKEQKPICSDLRIAELGASTEIANMALRKKSEVPVIIKSETRLKCRSYDLPVLNQESDMSGDGVDWLESAYSTIDESVKTNVMDRRLGSILKMPIQFFKKNILTRSSLINMLINTDSDHRNLSIIRKLKDLLYEEIAEHQGRGVRQLYSTINRKRIPYKLGWVDLVAKVSKIIEEEDDLCRCDTRCRHFRNSHSYRCMRAQVMKLAGPTNSDSEFRCVPKQMEISSPSDNKGVIAGLLQE